MRYVQETQLRETPSQSQGSMGRPKFVINSEQLSMLLEHRFSVPQIADMLAVSVSTVRRRMTEYGLSVGATYAHLDDDELDTLEKSNINFPCVAINKCKDSYLRVGFECSNIV